jgi:4-amino-4-deoxy-L-arabinose transferase-like glycosyltransferase
MAAIAGAGRRTAAKPRSETMLLAAAMAVALGLRLAYVVATQDHALAGDEIEYDAEGAFIAAGKWWWTAAPYGIPHEGLWKAPLYPAWVGGLYELLGRDPDRVFAVQALLGPLNVVLVWALGRRLYGSGVGLAAAAIVAVYPLAWQFEVRLDGESLATPLTLGILLLVLGRPPPSVRQVAAVGALLGAMLLLRPSGIYLLPAAAAAWVVSAGWRRGLALAALCAVVAALVVAPWTLRNHSLTGAWIPISLQEAAGYGTFNDEAASDPVYPWAWRQLTARDAPLFDRAHPLPDAELRDRLQRNTRAYVREHPESLAKALFWNGLSRTWDVRRPARAMHEVRFEGRTRAVTAAGLAMYYVLLPLALVGLWRVRRRPELVWPLVAIAIGASLVYTTDAGTRYRATLEPVIALLACSAVAGIGRPGAAAVDPQRRLSRRKGASIAA